MWRVRNAWERTAAIRASGVLIAFAVVGALVLHAAVPESRPSPEAPSAARPADGGALDPAPPCLHGAPRDRPHGRSWDGEARRTDEPAAAAVAAVPDVPVLRPRYVWVLDEHHAPIRGVHVEWHDSHGASVALDFTDEQGHAMSEPLDPTATYRVLASAGLGWEPQEVEVDAGVIRVQRRAGPWPPHRCGRARRAP